MKSKIIVALIVLISILGIVGISFFIYDSVNRRKVAIMKSSAELNPEDFDFENLYPKTPEQLIGKNNGIIKILYGGKVKDDQITELIEKQRMLFSKELLAENTLENHVNSMTKEINSFKEAKINLIDIEVDNLTNDKYSENIFLVDVIQYFKDDNNYKIKYYVIKEGDQHKILAWEHMGAINEK